MPNAAIKTNNNFDFLRLFAAVAIAFCHSLNLVHNTEYNFLYKNVGTILFWCVAIFFTVSGFLIAKSLDNSTSIASFFWKRLLRIQPLLIVICIISVFFLGAFFTTLSTTAYFNSGTTWQYFKNIFPFFGIEYTLPGVFENNIHPKTINGSLWTLVDEERLYVLMGLLFFFKTKKNIAIILFLVLVDIVFIAHRFFFKSELIPYFNGDNFTFILIFLNAALFYFLKINFTALTQNKFFHLLFLGLFISLFFLLGNTIFTVVAIPLCVLYFSHIKCFLNKAGKWGDFTYGIYIFSFPTQQVLSKLTTLQYSPILLFFCTMVIVLPLSVFSWHFFEKKILAYKNAIR